jgi:hypothetical protein
VNLLESGRTKEAADEGSAFIRTLVRQEAAVREILPPVGLTEDELDRDETTDQPKKIVEKEPDSFATFVEFKGTPESRWFTGQRYAVFFGKTVSEEMVKSKFDLMTYQNDIRKILADNMVKDMSDQEDVKWEQYSRSMVNLNPAQQITLAASFTSAAFKRGMQGMLLRRRPLGKMLMTKVRYMEAIDLPATAVGTAIAEAHYREGIENEERLFGMPTVTTIKVHVYNPLHVWMYAPQNFLGNFFLLQDATLFIEQRADIIKFHTYAAPGIGIGNRQSIQLIDFT